ncbi:transglutaminase-like cysteine peptidase [Pelagibacterium lentulum]|uniref:Transglutaminase-like cysteine proteinase n=1 Tax=Pelagibacterium lentulum TaxID=2029865 RepID=A0A916R607_9HYPH|nr:transglutaminase-like cysteine peptidase [Pelagibacterium lentulum]GGA36351.1 hypothetical protein GCM10011499_02120 [Pelagibacterium lentulum]
MDLRSFALSASFALFGLSGTAAYSYDSSSPAAQIKTAAPTAAPVGLQVFCLGNAHHCTSSNVSVVEMSQDLMAMLNRVNGSVNRSIRPRVRSTQVWELGARSGDCKDYSLNKRAQLVALGVPAGALRIAIGYTARGEGHAVLVVRTSAGDLVLDNLTNQIKPFHQTGHRLIAISNGDLRKWNTIV